MKLLYIGEKQITIINGWGQVNKRNQIVLERIFDEVKYIALDRKSTFQSVFLGITSEVIINTLNELSNGYDYVFVCQSLCGRICKIIKKHYPTVKVITFFHNIERQYAKEYYKVSGVRAIPYYLRVRVWEKMAVEYSDFCITLNERDSKLLESYYKRSANAILPTSLEDKFTDDNKHDNKPVIDYLFVGAAFYPNVEGVQWFIDNVMPHVKGKLCVVGKNMDYKLFRNLSDNVEIHGFVDDLAEYYSKSKMVVSPIFHGGGMKTKTAEALMYGKFIIGTDEALEGYVFNSECMSRCNTKDEFIKSILNIENKGYHHNMHSRLLFHEYYSYESSEKIMRGLLDFS